MSAVAAPPPGLELFWLAPQLGALRQARSRSRLPHALLIQDAPGAGGEQLALLAAQTALCSAARFRPAAAAASACSVCRSASHPDLWFLAPEEDSTPDQGGPGPCELTEALGAERGTASVRQRGDHQIRPTCSTPSSANALLKTLEEPRRGRADRAGDDRSRARLPATVLSRCQRLQVRPPSRARVRGLA